MTRGVISMKVQINFADNQSSPALDAYIRTMFDRLNRSERWPLTRVEVHLRDDSNKSPSRIDSKRCRIEARLAGKQPFVIEHRDEDSYLAARFAIRKLGRSLDRKWSRLQSHRARANRIAVV